MSFEIEFDFINIPKVIHECDLEYDPELDTIITLTTHISGIMSDNNAINFKIFINDINIKIYPYNFDIMVDQIDLALTNITDLENFEIDFFEEGDTKTVYFTLLDSENYVVEILESYGREKIDSYGESIISKSYMYNVLSDIMNKFIEMTKIYCPNAYNNEYFKEIFEDYL